MSLHVFASFVTPYGTANNNRAETEGNITTLQKLLWMGDTHSTVSAEAIRFALRRRLGLVEPTNRTWDEDERNNTWKDDAFKGWDTDDGKTFIDDDLLGFMTAEAAKAETEEAGSAADPKDKKKKEKGTANVRRSPLEVTRAVSLTPWGGDVVFNAASPGATPSAAKKGAGNPVPYGAEVHATRYQYGVALTPERLRDKSRAAKAVDALCNLGTVAGNHGRFLFDFSPDAVVFRLTQGVPAPRLLYCFGTKDDGKTVVADALVARLSAGDVDPKELVAGVSDLNSALAQQLTGAGLKSVGVKAACAETMKRINAELKIKGQPMLGVYVTVPVACFRKGLAREYLETEPLPPPATCYGFLLSLVGETTRRRHIGCRVAPVLIGVPAKSVVLRTMWRVKKAPLGSPGNTRPDYQQLLTDVRLLVWLDSSEEKEVAPTLESRVMAALSNPAGVSRFGGLCLGESTHLVDEVSPWERVRGSLGVPRGRAFLTAPRGRSTLPVWVDHVGSAGTRYATGDLEDVPLSEPPAVARLPVISPE